MATAMGVATSHLATVTVSDEDNLRAKREMSLKALQILEEVIASRQIADGTSQLVTLLRERNYSITELLYDLKAVKTITGTADSDFLDELLVACINQTAAIHEAAIESMLNDFCELTIEGQILYANPALISLLPGCEGRLLADYFPKHIDEIRDALSGRASKRVHLLELEADDHKRSVFADFGPVRRGASFYAFIIDLTNTHNASRRAHDTAPFAILKLDPDHRISYANEPESKLLGGTPETVVGRDARSLVQGPEDIKALKREYEKRRMGETSEYLLEVKPINQQPPARVVVRSIPEPDPDGRTASTFVTLSPITAQLTAQKILKEVSLQTDATVLFRRILDHLRSLVSFDTAILSVYASDRSFSRMVLSEPALVVDERWIPVPEALLTGADGPKPYGADLRETIRAAPDGTELSEDSVVQELIKRGLRGWYALRVREPEPETVRDSVPDAVLSLLHKHDCFGAETTMALEQAGVRRAMRAVLRLEFAREKDFQFKLLKDIAQATTDRDLADLVVTGLADFYGWQNVSVFKVNLIERRFELLHQAKARRGGFDLPSGYCQALDTGFLGKTFRKNEIQIASDAWTLPDKDLFVKSHAQTKTRSEMCVPIRLQGAVIWILNLEDERPNTFAVPEKATVERLMHELESSLERTLSSALLDEVLDTVPDAVVVTNLAGSILQCNLSARAMLGSEPKGEMIASFFPNDPECAAATTQQTSYPVEGVVISRDGTRTRVLVSARVPSLQYDRRVITMRDSNRLQWQRETSQLMQSLADVASQVRIPLLLASSFVRGNCSTPPSCSVATGRF